MSRAAAAATDEPCPDPAGCRVHEAHTLAGVGIPGSEPLPTIELRRRLTPAELDGLRHLAGELGLPFDDVFELQFSKAGHVVVLEAELADSARIAATR